MKLSYQYNRQPSNHREQFVLGSLSALLMIALPSVGAEKPFGVRNAFHAEEKQFIEYLPNGTDKLNQPGRAGIDDELRLEVVNFEKWKATQDPKLCSAGLTLYLDRKPVAGLKLQPYSKTDWVEVIQSGETNEPPQTNFISYFGVRLEQNADNRAVWKQLMRSPDFELTRPIEVSLGYAGGEPMNTWVYPTATRNGKSPFYLVILSAGLFYFGVSVIIGAFVAFVWLVRRTDVLRDPNLPFRPDGRRPLSLGRTQMAFWFFLVFSAFFLLWLATGYTDTLNASTLTLIGISAATAVSSAFIDTGRSRSLDNNVAIKRDEPETNEQIRTRLKADLDTTRKASTENQTARQAINLQDTAALAANDARQKLLQVKQALIEKQIEFFQFPLWHVALQDLLGENGAISFHRFQMCVWTIVLGIIFVWDVYSKGTMPEFDATLLGLMGISAGTFIGFKLPGK